MQMQIAPIIVVMMGLKENHNEYLKDLNKSLSDTRCGFPLNFKPIITTMMGVITNKWGVKPDIITAIINNFPVYHHILTSCICIWSRYDETQESC